MDTERMPERDGFPPRTVGHVHACLPATAAPADASLAPTMRSLRGNSQRYRVLVLAIGMTQAYGRAHHRIIRYGIDR